MASATKEQLEKDGKAMATDVVAPGGGAADDSGEDLPRGPQPSERPAGGGVGGFFAIYKKGQGYWTRMGTAISAALLLALTVYTLYVFLQPVLPFEAPQELKDKVTQAEKALASASTADHSAAQAALTTATNALAAATTHAAAQRRLVAMIIVGVLGLVSAYLLWRITNKPSNVDFLIATDSEMKKVNWTSRRELIGSTKVVVAFMFFIAFFLAVCDVVLAGFFQLIGVLQGGGHTLFGG